MPELWTITIDELDLPVRAHNTLCFHHKLTKAWHAAALCDACLLRTYQCGPWTLAAIRQGLAKYGFLAPVLRCAHPYAGDTGHRWSACQWDLSQCRAMLERGEWS